MHVSGGEGRREGGRGSKVGSVPTAERSMLALNSWTMRSWPEVGCLSDWATHVSQNCFISFSDCILFVYRNTIFFVNWLCILQLHWMCFLFLGFLAESWGFSRYMIVSLANRDNFTFSFMIWIYLLFLFLGWADIGKCWSKSTQFQLGMINSPIDLMFSNVNIVIILYCILNIC